MNCQQVEESLSAYADGAQNAKEQAAVQAHLAACPDCRRQLHELVALKELLRQTGTPQPTREFWPVSFERVLAAAESRRRVLRSALRLQAAGAVIAAAIIGFLTLQGPPGEPAPHAVQAIMQPTFDPAALVSMHALVRASRPLADAGKVRFAISEGHARDYANDERLDAQ